MNQKRAYMLLTPTSPANRACGVRRSNTTENAIAATPARMTAPSSGELRQAYIPAIGNPNARATTANAT